MTHDKLIIVLILVALLLGVCLFGRMFDKTVSLGSANIFTGDVTNTSKNASSTATTTLSRNLQRQYASLCNDGGQVVYLNFRPSTANVASTTAGTGYRLATATCYVIDSDNLYQDTVWMVTSSGTSTISVIEK